MTSLRVVEDEKEEVNRGAAIILTTSKTNPNGRKDFNTFKDLSINMNCDIVVENSGFTCQYLNDLHLTDPL